MLDFTYDIATHATKDGDEAPKTISFHGIDDDNYYILDKFGMYVH